MVTVLLEREGKSGAGQQQPPGPLGQLLRRWRLRTLLQSGFRALLPFLDHLTALLLALVHLGICLWYAPYGFNDFGADGGQFKTALDIAEGGVIFRDTWSQYGVFTHHLHALALLLLGKTLLSIKYCTCLTYLLVSYAQYFVLRRFLPRGLAVLTALAWLGVAPHYEHGIIPWPHVDAMLFQLLSLLCLFRFVDRNQGRYLVLAGVLTGLSWAAKQSVGAFHFVALLGFVSLAYLLPARPGDLLGLAYWRKLPGTFLTRVVPLVLGFAVVLGLILLGLKCAGALRHWHKQTIFFPRVYYLDYYLRNMPSSGPIIQWLGDPEDHGVVKQVLVLLLTWYRESVNATLPAACGRQWIVLWLAAIVVGWRGLGRADNDSRLGVLMGLVAATSWLGTVPSMLPMHQWWTLTPVFGMLSYLLWTFLKDSAGVVRWAGTVTVLAFLFAYPICSNLSSTAHAERTRTITQIPALKGMKTTPATAETLETLYQAITLYRQRYPSCKLTTVDDQPQTLLFLTFVENNRNFHPIYWSCPILTWEKVYPEYYLPNHHVSLPAATTGRGLPSAPVGEASPRNGRRRLPVRLRGPGGAGRLRDVPVRPGVRDGPGGMGAGASRSLFERDSVGARCGAEVTGVRPGRSGPRVPFPRTEQAQEVSQWWHCFWDIRG